MGSSTAPRRSCRDKTLDLHPSKLERKWVTPEYHFVRVGRLPFMIRKTRYEKLSEGESVKVIFRLDDKRVDQIERVIVPGAFEEI